MTNALLEIGVEHLPARFMPGALAQLETLAAAQLKEHNIGFESVRAFGTFRKLALHIKGLEDKSKDIEKEVKGPPAKLLKDAAGNYTPQSAGFAQKNGIKPEKLITMETPNGPFIYAKLKIKGVNTAALLPQIFTKIITSLEFPKNMVWEESGLRFARPIRTLIGLYGDKVIKFEVAGVKSNRITWPITSFGTKGIKIENADSYVETLRNQPQPILAEPQERKEILIKAVSNEAALRNAVADLDEELIMETVFMTEHPVAVAGDFEIRFLTLPKELITTVLKKQIRMFPVTNKEGKIEPYFIAVRDGISVNQDEVRDGFKKVMSARLSDAVFFFEQDTKKGFNSFREKLSTVQFIEGLGDMLTKTNRTKELALWLAQKCSADKAIVEKAADYAYADLTSGVVYEFPELQGYMGGVYAEKEGFAPAVCKALQEFYYPLTASSELPSSVEAAIVSLAGKMDAITGNFAVGQIPTGSEDPFALRRQAMGVVRMLIDYNMPLTLKDLAQYSMNLYGNKNADILKQLIDFLWARVTNILEQQGYDHLLIAALSGREDKAIGETFTVARALKDMRADEALLSVAQSAKRVANILKKSEFVETDPKEKFFETDTERKLASNLFRVEVEFHAYENKLLTELDCKKIFSHLAGFKDNLEEFFEKVMVNVENKDVRNNRLNMLKKAHNLLTTAADISKLA
ncbi:glycyl-tRNA synthetase beta chain [Elusimicrobium posterum]|uniref:glycine--tRNA ligase subunit beta n=1 Tax=Elusimicrobium posterum TaxID=3116653 RepID=UPI003C72A455